MNKDRHIVLFDGVCNLCNSSVRWVHKRDKNQMFQYQSLQSKKGNQLLEEFNYKGEHLKSFVYIKNNTIYNKSSAALQVAKSLGFPYSIAQFLLLIPTPIRNGVYDYIAKNRYKWFGKSNEVCEFDPNFNTKIIR